MDSLATTDSRGLNERAFQDGIYPLLTTMMIGHKYTLDR
jgi:hypothetical protein